MSVVQEAVEAFAAAFHGREVQVHERDGASERVASGRLHGVRVALDQSRGGAVAEITLRDPYAVVEIPAAGASATFGADPFAQPGGGRILTVVGPGGRRIVGALKGAHLRTEPADDPEPADAENPHVDRVRVLLSVTLTPITGRDVVIQHSDGGSGLTGGVLTGVFAEPGSLRVGLTNGADVTLPHATLGGAVLEPGANGEPGIRVWSENRTILIREAQQT